MPTASPILAWLVSYRYAIAFPLAIVEGPVVMIVAGFLVHTGFFEFWPIYLVLVAGDLTADIGWYFAGKYGGRPLIEKYGHFFDVTEANVERAETFFHKHQTKILFISKLTTGFGMAIAVLIAAGAARVPFKKYFTVNFFGEFVWAGFLFSIGYFFGQLYSLVNKGFQWMFLAALITLAGLAMYGFTKAMRKKFRNRVPLS